MIVVLPIPAGSPAAGAVVAVGITKNGVPDMNVVLPKLTGIAAPAAGAIVVGPGTTTKEEPPITVVLPCKPGGALARGIVVDPVIVIG